jgi:hypothetical protein
MPVLVIRGLEHVGEGRKRLHCCLKEERMASSSQARGLIAAASLCVRGY